MTPRRVLVVGGGAREHALCRRLATEPGVERVIVAPGNPLMAGAADVRPDAAGDTDAIVALAVSERVGLAIVGPEAPLVGGLADALAGAGVACFGPTAAAARLEGSKSFARQVCAAAGVRMAEGRSFDDLDRARAYVRSLEGPVVVKADGLAAGKGVTICTTVPEADQAIAEALHGRRFGAAGRRVVVERRLEGVEASVIAITDGRTALALPAARDHKRLGEGDTGPNTGGMGAYSPLDELDGRAVAGIVEKIHLPVLREMETGGTPFRGALFAGLMLTRDGPCVLEFNARFGDPETQVLLPRLALPIAPLLAASAAGRLGEAAREAGIAGAVLPAREGATVGVTLAADGYPDAPRGGDAITGIDAAEATGALVFGAGVREDAERGLVTAGGRVVTVVGSGRTLESAADRAYAAADGIRFDGRQLRRDIGRAAPVAAQGAA